MAEYEVEVQRTFTATVTVKARNAEAALEKVDRRDFPLPALEEWHGLKDWAYVVYSGRGRELLRTD